jgi:hypothetical protein
MDVLNKIFFDPEDPVFGILKTKTGDFQKMFSRPNTWILNFIEISSFKFQLRSFMEGAWMRVKVKHKTDYGVVC